MREIPPQTLGSHLRSIRDALEPVVTLEAVATALDTTRSTIWKIENDRARPFADQLDRYLDAVNATASARALALELAGERGRGAA